MRRTTPARALDLGCGTGTNAVYLARHNWDVVGVDFSRAAISRARSKARDSSSRVAARLSFHLADVTDLGWLQSEFGIILDQGCFHTLRRGQRPGYAAGVRRLLGKHGLYLLFAFKPGVGRIPGASYIELLTLFAPELEITKVEEGTGVTPAAWYTLRRE